MGQRSYALAVGALLLFAGAAVFWADYYVYMKSAHAAGESFTVRDYATSIGNRVAGRPDAATLRRLRDRAQAEARAVAAATATAASATPDENRRAVGSAPQFVDMRERTRTSRVRGVFSHDDSQDANAAGSRRFGGGGAKFVTAGGSGG